MQSVRGNALALSLAVATTHGCVTQSHLGIQSRRQQPTTVYLAIVDDGTHRVFVAFDEWTGIGDRTFYLHHAGCRLV